MTVRTRKCAVFMTLLAVAALYGTAAWRVEQARQVPRIAASCGVDQCIPHSAMLNALR